MASIPRRAEAPLLITVVGPTAIGKTYLAIRIAQAIGAEITFRVVGTCGVQAHSVRIGYATGRNLRART